MLRRNLVLSICVLVACGWMTTAGAHTAVRVATPGPGDTVSSPVGEVRVEFLDGVQPGAQIELSDPGGEPVPPVGRVQHLDDGTAIVQAFEPATTPGDHRVDYRYTALDGAAQAGAYEFEVVADAGTSGRFGPGSGLVAMAVTLALAAAGAVAWRRRR